MSKLHSHTDWSFSTGGSDYGSNAKAGTDNAQTFWDEGVCGMLAWGGNVFYFEAFDEYVISRT